MLQIREHEPLGPKTTMRIGGAARWYAELTTKKDCEEAYAFACTKKCPLVVLGGGSNTIFDDGVIQALVVRVIAQEVTLETVHRRHPEPVEGCLIHVEAGKNLAQLVNELAERDLDLSPLTGIPGTVGGAVFGNAGQGFGAGENWIGNYVKEVEVFLGGKWEVFWYDKCKFSYRHSIFKETLKNGGCKFEATPIIWSVTLEVPSCPKEAVQAEIERLLKRRIETQPHVKTAGSCFLSISEDLPAWKLIDTAGLRGKKIGGVAISEKHANFLIAEKGATFADAKALVETVQKIVGAQHAAPLHVEMRLIDTNGRIIA